MRTTRFVLGIMLLAYAMPAFAAWPPGGKFVMKPFDSFNGTDRVWIMPHPSGDLLVHGAGVGGNAYGFSAQRISTTGDVATDWPAQGLSFGTMSKTYGVQQTGFALDGLGNLWHMTANGSRMATLRGVEPGLLSPASPINLTSTSSAVARSAFAAGPSGGVYAYWSNKLQRLTASGTVATGWPVNALTTIHSFSWQTAAIADGAGGVVIMTIDLGNTLMPVAQHVDSTGVRHAGWPALGLPLSDDPLEMQTTLADLIPSLPALIPSGPSAFLAAWPSLPDGNGFRHIVMQRVGMDGVRDPSWPSGGRQVMLQGPLAAADILPDRSGGAYVVWFDGSTALASHVLVDGTFANAAGAQGTWLVQPGDAYRPPLRSLSNRYDHVPAAVTSDGGLVFAWDDTLTSDAMRVRWYTPSLAIDSREPAEGRLIQANADFRTIRELHGDDSRGVYVAWEQGDPDALPNSDVGDIWMTHLDATPIGAGVTPTREVLALSAPRPNPARGSTSFELTLPDDSPATLELLDLAGRVVQSRSVSGAGRHAITFDALERMSPGLYFVRASTRSEASTTRVVVSH